MKFETPLFVTIACILSWCLISVVGRAVLIEYNLAPAMFVFIQMISGGLSLVLLSPKRIRDIGFSPLKHFHTWAFGGLRIVSASFYVGSFLYFSATNTAFLGASNVTLSVLYVWFLLGRKPKWIEVPGHIVIAVAWFFFARDVDDGFSNPGIWLLLASQVIITIAITLGETHPLNQNNNSGDTLYLTGMVLFASAVILLALSYLASIFEATLPADFYPVLRSHITGFVLKDFLNPYAWGWGFLTGATFRAAAIYYSLRSVKLTSSEFYLGTMALMPFVNMAFEALAAYWEYLPHSVLDAEQIILGTIMAAASMYIVYFKRSK